MSRNVTPPFFPIPPESYEQRYFAELTRAFSLFINQQNNPGEGRNTKLVLTDLPSSETGLEPGTLFQEDGFVKIVLAYRTYLGGLSSTASVGTVTVTTT
jgi:hypothetical protein